MNYHEFFRKLENYLEKIERQPSLKETLGVIIQGILTDFTDDLGLTGARLYYLEGGRYTLVEKYGAESPAPIGFAIPENYPPIRKLRRKGFIYMDLQTLGVDPELEGQFGVKRFAALAVGPGSPYVIAFGILVARCDTEDEILFMLSSIRHSINM